MKILHVDSALEWRGGQNQVFLTALGMAARGHAVTLACRAGGVLEERARAARLPVRPVVFGRGDVSFSAAFGLATLYGELRPDVVHLHDPHGIGAGLLAARLAGQDARIVGTRRVDFRVRGTLSRWKYGACDRVIAVSRAIAAVLEEGGVPRERVRLVYEGVPDRPPEGGGREALAALGVPTDAPIVGKVAALADHKDHMTFLAAAAQVSERLPDARFLIVGDGELRSRVEDRVRELGLNGHCVLTGFRTDMDRLIPAFTVFCLSSHMEGLGTSLLDAMCFSRPIVATAAGGIPEAVEDGLTGRVVPVKAPEALAAALVEVLSDPHRQRAMGEAGRRRFEDRFTADRMVEETLKVYAEIGVKVRAIVNPRAGAGARRALAALEQAPAGLHGLAVSLSERAGHARELAREAAQAGCDLVLAVGGDGTANEVAWGLLGSQAALGLVPVGSGNGLARTLGIPLAPRRALQALADAVTRRMDVGFVNERPFLNVAGAGFDAAVGAAFHERARAGARRGVLGYVWAGLGIALGYRASTLGREGAEPSGRAALLFSFSNGPQYGGGAVIAPGARLDDGLLDVVRIEDAPRLRLLLQAPRLFLGGIERLSAYSRTAVASFVLTAGQPFEYHRDGEPEPPVARLEVRIEPKALPVLVARPVAEDPRGPFLPA